MPLTSSKQNIWHAKDDKKEEIQMDHKLLEVWKKPI